MQIAQATKMRKKNIRISSKLELNNKDETYEEWSCEFITYLILSFSRLDVFKYSINTPVRDACDRGSCL